MTVTAMHPEQFKRFLAAASFETLDALGLCDCGVPLDVHPPLPNPKPLSSWHSQRNLEPPQKNHKPGRALTVVGSGVRLPKEGRAPRVKKPSLRMLHMLDTLRRNGGNKSQTARQLGVTTQAVQQCIYRAREMGLDA